jgi:hypothetical protein
VSSKKSTSDATSSSQTATTATPTVPDWILNPSQQVAGNIGGLINQGPSAFAPQVSNLQQQSFNNAANLTQNQNFNAAGTALNNVGSVTGDQVQGSSLLDNLQSYYNPFQSQVLDPTLAAYDKQAGMTTANNAAQAAMTGAFGGSRYGVQQAQSQADLAQGRASTEGTLLNQMYGQATTLADQDAARRQQAALANQSTDLAASQSNQQAELARAAQLASLGTAQGADTRANLGVQANLGGIQTDAENAMRQYPLQFQQQMGTLLQGINPSNFIGKTVTGTQSGQQAGSTTETPSLLSSIGQAAQIGATLFSDRRLKLAVRTLFHDLMGRRWVEFAYRWAPTVRRFGVIAQEILGSDPDAVTIGAGGYLRVDYGRLGYG